MRNKGIHIIGFLLFALLNSCTPTSVKTIDWQGHRGARGEMPENTIPAFLHALSVGVQTLEMDVVISADGLVVVSHEPFFNSEICAEVPDSLNNIYQLSYAGVRQVDCGSKQNSRFPNQQNVAASKPLLQEVIEASETKAKEIGRELPFYNIEIKSRPEWDGVYHPEIGEYADRVMKVIESSQIGDRYTIQSFDLRTLKYLHKVYPKTKLVLLTEDDIPLEDLLGELEFIPEVYSPYFKLLNSAVVKQAQEKGMKVIPWTVNDTTNMKAMIDLGVDGIITDYPTVAISRFSSGK